MCSKSKAVPARLVAAQGPLGALHPPLCCGRPRLDLVDRRVAHLAVADLRPHRSA